MAAGPEPGQDGGVAVLKLGNLTVAFLLELVLLVAVGWWGSEVDAPIAIRVLLAFTLPALVGGFWVAVLAPTATRRLPMPWLLVVKLGLYALAAAAWVVVGHPLLGGLTIATAAVSLGLAVLWRQGEVISGHPLGARNPGSAASARASSEG